MPAQVGFGFGHGFGRRRRANGGGGGGAQTLLQSRRLGNQFATLTDWTPDALTNDLMLRARNMAPTSGSAKFNYAYSEHAGLNVQSLTRSGGSTVAVVLANAPEAFLVTGMKVVLQCMTDSTFDVPDGAAITVTDQTHFTYTKAGANGSPDIPSIYDCPAGIINQVALGAAGHPIEDFYCHICSISGMSDLHGTYTITFPGSSCSVAAGGASLVGNQLTISAPTNNISLTFTGVPSDGSFRVPRVIRNDHDQTGATLLRPDFKKLAQRWGVHRDMDLANTNYGSNIQGWGSRPQVSVGRGFTIEDRVRICNEAGCDMYFVVPTMATDAYVTNALTYIRDNLSPSLKVYIELSNEVWNRGYFPHGHWVLGMLRRATKAVYHGYISNEVVSISRTGSTVTYNLTRPVPFANGATIKAAIYTGSAGYDTPANGAVATVSGNSFSFTNTGSASGAASFSKVAIFGDASSPIVAGTDYNIDGTMVTRMLAQRTYEIAQLASAVFGGLMTRARPVLMWQHVQYSVMQTDTMPWLLAQYGSVSAWLWGIGSAPYSKAAGSDTTPANVRDSLIAYCDTTCDDNQHLVRYIASKYGVNLINYEGGIDLNNINGNQSLVDSLYAATEIRTAAKHLIDHAFGFGADLSLQLNSSMSPAGTQGSSAWGIGRTAAADAVDIGSATCQKLKGIDDALQATEPPVIDPNQLPGTLNAIGGTTYKDNQVGYATVNGMRQLYDNANSILEWVFYAPGGPIALTVWGRIIVGGGSNGARVYLDGSLAGTATLQTTTGDLTNGPSGGLAATNVVTISPAKGWHILAVRPPASQPDLVGISRVVGA